MLKQTGTSADICFQLMGDARFIGPGDVNLTPRSRKGTALVAILALTPGRTAGRERILGLLWGDRGEEQARASLRQALVDLRVTAPAIAALLVSTRQAVSLVPDGWTTDVALLEAAAATGDAEALLQRMQAMRGELLAGLQGLSPPFDDWLFAERTQRRALINSAALGVAQDVAAHQPETARALATALMIHDPGNEDACRFGMRLDRAAGDLASLHRRFRMLEQQLEQEFDAKPSPETHRLVQELTTSAGAAAVARPAEPGAAGPAERPEPPVLLVTPLAVLDDRPDAKMAASILSEELETALGRYRELRVLASAQPEPHQIEALTRGAVVSYGLGGSARGGASGVRINVRLNELGSGRVVWSRQLELDAVTTASAVDELVDMVVGAVLPAVQRDLLGPSAPTGAYSLYYGGLEQLCMPRSFESLKAAGELFEKAIAQHPGNVSAMLRLSLLYNTDFRNTCAGHDAREWRARALALVREAARIDPENARAYAHLGWCHLRTGATDAATAAFGRATELAPHYADIMEMCAFGLCCAGDLKQAEALMRRAFRLNPFPSPDYFAENAVILALNGAFREALWHFGESTDPSVIYVAVQAAALAHAGEIAPAHERCDELRQRFARIWRSTAPMTDADVLRWTLVFLPLHHAQHRAMLEDGLRAGGLRA